jgi:hypothetical protein
VSHAPRVAGERRTVGASRRAALMSRVVVVDKQVDATLIQMKKLILKDGASRR